MISNVLPGLAEVFAKPLWLQSILIRLDLPTLERPMKAYSGLVSTGHFVMVGDEMVNSDFVIFIFPILSFNCQATKHSCIAIANLHKKNEKTDFTCSKSAYTARKR